LIPCFAIVLAIKSALGDDKRPAIARLDLVGLLDQSIEATAYPRRASHREACGYKPPLGCVADIAH
jgi:hypothetical protein